MLEFWIIAASLTLLALIFVVPPLLRTRSVTEEADRNTLNVAIYKERLAELEQEQLPPVQFALAQQELDKNLAQELEETKPSSSQPRAHCFSAVLLAVLIPFLAIGLYLKWGEPQFLMSPLAQFSDDPQVLSDFAEFLARSNNGQLAGLPRLLLKSALEQDPNHQQSLWWSGLAALQDKDYMMAVTHWQRLLAQLSRTPDAAEFTEALQKHIAKAQRLAQGKAPSTSTVEDSKDTPSTTADQVTQIKVHVRLAPELQAQIKPEDTVFIYARATQGSAMPIAIVKKFARDLPTTVILDKSTMMMPNMKLSTDQAVTIIARLSKSGSAAPQSGDLQGQISSVTLNQQTPVEVVINRIVP